MATDMQITFKDKVYVVPEGFTVEQMKDSLASQFPEAETATLIDDGDGKWTLKTTFKQKG